jgi:distribution and morphology protein 12
MSFEIDWSLLQDGVEAKELVLFLNSRFEAISRPNFLGPISVQSFSFGSIPPEVSIVNITEPMEDFYLADADMQSTSDSQLYHKYSDTFTENRDFDCQIEIDIAYKGDMSMSISTELIINQPTPGFLSLPLSLTLTKSNFKGKIAVLTQSHCDSRLHRKFYQFLSR